MLSLLFFNSLWRYSQSCWYFNPALWTIAPLPSLQFNPPPPPRLNKYRSLQSTQCVTGGGGRVVWRAYSGVKHSEFDQILNLQNCFTTPNKNRKNWAGEGSSDRETPAAKYLYWSIFKKSWTLGFEATRYLVYISDCGDRHYFALLFFFSLLLNVCPFLQNEEVMSPWRTARYMLLLLSYNAN